MDLKTRDQLRSDVFNSAGLHILPKGTMIRNEEIALLIRHSIDMVDIEIKEDSETDLINEEQLFYKELKQDFDYTMRAYQGIFLDSLVKSKFNPVQVQERLETLLESIDSRKNVVGLLMDLGREDATIYNHSLQVGLLSYYIATWLGYSKEESHEISQAGYLHDIGKSKVPHAIRDHVGELTGKELEIMQNHTRYGYDIIRNSMSDGNIALVALQHHELEDGSGYPLGLGKNAVHSYSQIVAVANKYVDLTSQYQGKGSQGFLKVLRTIYDLGFGKLNEKPVQALIKNLLPNILSKKVELSNGREGIIILNNPNDIFRPLVKVGEEFVDLAKNRDILIEEIYL